MLRRLITEMERVSAQLAEIDKVLAKQTLADPRALRLMTIPGVGSVVASVVLASIGDITRFPSPDKLSSYFGLTPRIRQSGDHPARHGRISKQGNADARKMLVEAAWSAKTAQGPLRAFFIRVQKKRSAASAAVATARDAASGPRRCWPNGCAWGASPRDRYFASSPKFGSRPVMRTAGSCATRAAAVPERLEDRVQPSAMSAGGVAIVVKARAEAAGLDPATFAGHSLRSGFLTEAARQPRANVFKMREVSRHKSLDVLAGYVREHDGFRNHAGEQFL